MKKIVIIGAKCGWGAKHKETLYAFDSLIEQPEFCQLYSFNQVFDWDIVNIDHTNFDSLVKKEAKLTRIYHKLAATLKNYLKINFFPIIIGGDHSIAISTWSTFSTFYNKRPFGLIWFDAHLDSHTISTSPSGNIHGMPLATLLGFGDSKFTQFLHKKPKILPENLFIIGARSYEPEEQALLHSLGVRVFYKDEVEERSLKTCLNEAYQSLHQNNIPYGISIDLDFFDPEFIPSVGTPVKNGIIPSDFMKIMHNNRCFSDPLFKGIEIAEYNPFRDPEGKGKDLIFELLFKIFK